MRKRNWRKYNTALVQRGRFSFLIDPQWLKQIQPKKPKGTGHPLAFSDQLILILMMIKIHLS
ncbi:MAG: hypothetical protein NT065_06075 [Chlamydiae bacterium]|nr:hypothetical protein [Chlamydiota bacterium]